MRALLPAVALALAALPLAARAQPAGGPALDRAHHTAWTQADTLMLGGSRKVVRSPDGYLWLPHALGLLRFDGVRFTVVHGAHEPALRMARSGVLMPRLVDRSGTLWIARPDGALVTYREGRFAVAVPAARKAGTEVTADRAGRLWIWRRGPFALSRWRDGRLESVPLPRAVPDSTILAVVADERGGFWIGTRTDGLWHAGADGSARRIPALRSDPETEQQVRPLLQARDGALWAVGNALGPGRVLRLVDGAWRPVPLDGAPNADFFAREAVEAPDGTVWLAGTGNGLLQWRDGRLRAYGARDGLSDPNTASVLLDEEGSVWVTTDAGLDRLRAAPFHTLSSRHGLPFDVAARIVDDDAGDVWIQQHVTSAIYRLPRRALREGGPLRPTRAALPPTRFQLLAPARGGGVWLAPPDRLARLDGRGLRMIGEESGVPVRRVWHAVEARDGALWTALLFTGLGRLRDGRWRPVALPGAAEPRVAGLAADGHGRVWVSLEDRPLLFALDGDSVVRRLGASDGLTEPLTDLAAERGDTLWGLGRESIVRVIGGRVARIPTPQLAHVLQASAAPLVAGGLLWIAGETGIVHLPLPALHRIADGAREPLVPTTVATLDGVAVPKTPTVTLHPVWRGRGGEAWITTPSGVMVAEGGAAPRNERPPRVHIEELRVGGRVLAATGAVAVGPRAERVELRFTATGLLVPERVRVAFRLDGVDDEWRAAGVPRTVTYDRLRPGRYLFRVRAWNEDGVPSVREARLAMRVLPAWYQTWWFAGAALLAVAATGAGGVLAVQRDRERRRAEALRARFQATLDERTRLAREMHDTLLQGFTGITLQLQAVRRLVDRAPERAADALERVLGTADATLRDARQMVWDMRPPELDEHDLPDALAAAARGAVAGTEVAVDVAVRGERRRLAPDTEAAALRIGREAVANAIRHARPRRVTIDLHFAADGLRVRVRDDGTGFDPDTPSGGPHLGLRTMRERAARAGGTLALASVPGEGTEVSAFLPVPRDA